MIIVAKKRMKWRGYGFVLEAGRNQVDFHKLPYGLRRSIERHAKHHHCKLIEEETTSNDESTSSTEPTNDVVQVESTITAPAATGDAPPPAVEPEHSGACDSAECDGCEEATDEEVLAVFGAKEPDQPVNQTDVELEELLQSVDGQPDVVTSAVDNPPTDQLSGQPAVKPTRRKRAKKAE